ncbi:MAG: hypothetical protein WBA91_01880 [Paracoccaceae bacterium]
MTHHSLTKIMSTALLAGLIVSFAASAASAGQTASAEGNVKVSVVDVPGWGKFDWLAPKKPAPLAKLQNARLVSSDGSSIAPAILYGSGNWVCSYSGAGARSSCNSR